MMIFEHCYVGPALREDEEEVYLDIHAEVSHGEVEIMAIFGPDDRVWTGKERTHDGEELIVAIIRKALEQERYL